MMIPETEIEPARDVADWEELVCATPEADAALLAPCEMISFVDSMVAPLSLMNALLVELASRMGADVSATFGQLEDIWNKYGVFGKMDDE